MVDTFRVELSDGQWWEIKRRLLHGDRRHIDEHVQRVAFKYMKQLQESGLKRDELEDMVRNARNGADDARRNPDEDDALLLYGTVGWSFTEPVSLDNIAKNRYEDDTQTVLAHMHKFYDRKEEVLKN